MPLSYFAQAQVAAAPSAGTKASILSSELPGPKHPLPKFRKTNARALLMGDAALYDSSLTRLRELSNYNGVVVDVVALSDNFYKGFDEYDSDTCIKFRYVRIRHKDFEGLVKGRYVYQVINSPQNREIRIGSQSVKLKATSSYAEKKEWTPECDIATHNETPLLYTDSRSGYQGPVYFVNGDEFRLNTPYMELAADKNDQSAIPVSVVGEGFELKILLRFPTAPDVGDEPSAPTRIEIRREGKGPYTAFIHPKNE